MKICYQCKKCGKHWDGKWGENNAEECCKFLELREILEKQRYWRETECSECGEYMQLIKKNKKEYERNMS